MCICVFVGVFIKKKKDNAPGISQQGLFSISCCGHVDFVQEEIDEGFVGVYVCASTLYITILHLSLARF